MLVCLASAFIVCQEFTPIIGQIMTVHRKGPIFQRQEPGNAFFCESQTLCDVLLHDSPKQKTHIYINIQACGCASKDYSHDALLQIPLPKISKMQLHEFLDVLRCNFMNCFTEIHGRGIPFFDHSINESLVDDKGIIVW